MSSRFAFARFAFARFAFARFAFTRVRLHARAPSRGTPSRACERWWKIELDHQQLKRELGLERYEGRSWPACYHRLLERPLPSLPTPFDLDRLRRHPTAVSLGRDELCTIIVVFSSRQILVWAESG